MNQTTATRGGFSFTFTRRQPVFAGCSEFIPGLKTELGEVHHKFAVHDSRIHGGSVYYTCKIFPQHCFFNFSSVIWEFVTSSPKVSLGPFSFSICSVYFKLPWIILLILHSYYPLFNLAWILFRSTAPNPVLAAQSLAVSLYPKYQTPVPTTVYPSMIHVPTIKKEIAENPYSFQGACQHCSSLMTWEPNGCLVSSKHFALNQYKVILGYPAWTRWYRWRWLTVIMLLLLRMNCVYT